MPKVMGKLGAVGQLLRIKPVASWGIAAFALGASMAVASVGADANVRHGLLAILLVIFAQGFVSHGLNDAYDWLTGTDKESVGKGTGGSRVIPEGKLTLLETLGTAIIGLVGVAGIGAYFINEYGLVMAGLFAVAIWSPVSYSVPPLKLGYRPFNELVVVLPALVSVVAGTYLVMAGTWSWAAVAVGVVHALLCISWFIVSRVPDYEPDRRVGKVTSVVYVGRNNAALLSSAYLALALPVATVLTLRVSPVFVFTFVVWPLMMLGLATMDAYDPTDASRVRLQNMHLTTAHALFISAELLVWGF